MGIKKKPLGEEGIYVAPVRYGYTLRKIGDFLGVHYSRVGKALKKTKGGKQRRVNKIQKSRPDPMTPINTAPPSFSP